MSWGRCHSRTLSSEKWIIFPEVITEVPKIESAPAAMEMLAGWRAAGLRGWVF